MNKEKMLADMKARLKKALDESGVTIPEIVKKLGVTDGGVRKWFNTGGIATKRVEPLAKILGVDPVWLQTGHSPTKVREHSPDYKTDRDVMIPIYDVHLSAGNGASAPEYVETDRSLPFDSNWLIKNRLKAKDCMVLKVKGDSMHPTLEDGDSVLIDKSQTNIIDRNIYALVLGHDLKIKRLVRRYDGSIEVISDNPQHETETIPADSLEYISIIGRAAYRSGNL